MSTQITTASREWATRPDDQRFLSLSSLKEAVQARRNESWTTSVAVQSLRVKVLPEKGLAIEVLNRTRGLPEVLQPSNWSFGQLSQYAQAPASYLRKLPDELAAINLQWGLENNPVREGSLVLGQTGSGATLRSMTSLTYGRIWDVQVVDAVLKVNQDNRWVVPTASYSASNPKRATTLYASDRDVFIFLVDPAHAIEVPGEKEPLFRGFITWNSEVGSAVFGLTTFLYRTCCDNRIIWGATNIQELRIRHTGGAPERFAYEGSQYLNRYANESSGQIVQQIQKAKQFELPKGQKGWSEWLQDRGFTAAESKAAVKTAQAEEGEVRDLWAVIQGITASARSISHTDSRVDLESRAGKLMRLVE